MPARFAKAVCDRPVQAQRINQLELASQMYGVVKYPNGYSYNAGPSPFCGCNNGCGNI